MAILIHMLRMACAAYILMDNTDFKINTCLCEGQSLTLENTQQELSFQSFYL